MATDLQTGFSIVPPLGWAPLVRRSNGLDVRRMAEFSDEKRGKPNRVDAAGRRISGTADTERQHLLSVIRFRPYKLDVSHIGIDGQPLPEGSDKPSLRNDPDHDYYALDGYFEHSVFGTEFVSADRGVKRVFTALGYFADQMMLNLTFVGDDVEVFEFAPTSTVGTQTESLTIGLTVSVGFGTNSSGSKPYKTSGLGPAISVATQIAWTRTYSAPSVTMTPSRTRKAISFLVNLPGREYAYDGSGAPKPPSISYFFEPQIIVRVRKGSGLFALINSLTTWLYIWPLSTIDDSISSLTTVGFGINAFQIADAESGLVLDYGGGGQGAEVGLASRKPGAGALSQLWHVGPDGHLRTLTGGMTLAIAENNAASGRLILWDPLDEDGQRWTLSRARPQDDSGTLASPLGVLLASRLEGGSDSRQLVLRRTGDPAEQGESREWCFAFPEGGYA